MNLSTAIDLVERHASQCQFASSYGEPGYDEPKAGILLANWHNVPKYIAEGLERRGFELEWEDEWIVSYENNSKAYRTSPDSYSWTPFYVLTDDGDVIGGDEIESGDQLDWYVNEYLLNNPRRANLFKIDLAKLGFSKFNGEFETGLHPGMNDDPKAILARIRKELPSHDVVLSVDGQSQFYTEWTAWTRPQETDESN